VSGEETTADRSRWPRTDRAESAHTANASALSPGTVFAGRYRIVSLLGRGAMGEVYRADDLKLGQPIALKFLPTDLSGDASRIRRFATEVRVAREIAHPNVCRVFDIGESDGRHYLSMEYIDGEDLASLLRRIGRLPVEKALEVARELCAGIAAAHARGVLHRDLKPANIMIDGRGHAHITDFGLAVTIGSRRFGEIAGTPAYMAPEQVAGGIATEQTDLFSLGLILHELVTGIRIFNVATLTGRRQAEAGADSVMTSPVGRSVHPVLDALIEDCLQHDPARRPVSARAIAAALPGGGDLLAATLAAGETPSPGMVAAAGETQGLSRNLAWTCFGVALLGLFVAAWQMKATMVYRQAPLVKPPDALIDRAQRIVSTMGYVEPPIDEVHWFTTTSRLDYLERDRSGGYEDVRRSTGGGDQEVFFIYRQSPQPLVPENTYGIVTYREPPADVPGMADVTLDRLGRLVRFTGVPGASTTASPARQRFDWKEAFTEAGIDSSRLRAAEAAWTAPVTFDSLSAWDAARSDRPADVLRVTLATWHGWPVFFDVRPSPGPAESPRAAGDASARPVTQLTLIALTLAALVGASILARRNVREGRWDRPGALKAAGSILVLGTTWGLLRAKHVAAAPEEYLLISRMVGLSLFYAGSVFLSYIAFEPLVRRRWPLVLTSWNRVLSGRILDPLVGRDALAGALIGLGVVLLRESEFAISRLLGLGPAAPITGPLDGLGSAREFVSLVLFVQLFSLQLALSWLLILLLFRMILRSDRATIVLSVIALAPLTTLPGNHLVLETCLGALITTLSIVAVLRFGLVALIVELVFSAALTLLPISLDAADWYEGRSIIVLIGLAAVTAWAAYAAHDRSAIPPRAEIAA
jgi:predicted Ser/Thr protein kinase